MKFTKSLIIVFITCWTLQSDASAMDSGGSLFAYDFISRQLLSFDRETGAATVVGPTGLGPVIGTTYDSTSNQLLGSAGRRVVEIDPETGSATELSTLTVGSNPAQVVNVNALAYDSTTNTLFGIDQFSDVNDLVRIDRDSGDVEVIGSTGFSAVLGLEYDPFSDRLLAVASREQTLITIDRATGVGAPIFDAPLGSTGSGSLAIDTTNGDAFGLVPTTLEFESIDLQSGLITQFPLNGNAPPRNLTFGLVFVPASIPEPTSSALLGLGCCVFASCRRRRSCV